MTCKLVFLAHFLKWEGSGPFPLVNSSLKQQQQQQKEHIVSKMLLNHAKEEFSKVIFLNESFT